MLNDTYLFLFISIPLLSLTLFYMVYNYYKEISRQRIIIDTLSSSTNKILDENRKKEVSLDNKNNWLRQKLNYAGFLQKGAEYGFILISLAFGVLIAFFVQLVAKSPVIAGICFMLFSLFPLLVLTKIIKNREEEFNFALKQIIDKTTSMMKSGVGFEQAFKKSILTSKSELAKKVLGIYISEKSVIGEDRCFEKMFNLIESKELRIFYLIISIGKQSGGKFSNTLEKLRKTLHDQGEIKQEITSSTKEIKVGSYMIIGLVFITYYMMNNALKGVLNEHFFGSPEGKIQLFFIALWVSFGLFVNSMLSKVK